MEIKVVRNPNEYPYDKFEGFTKIAELEWNNESYEFDLTGVWTRDSDGTVWSADDSGCSCPCPWERVDKLDRVFSFEPFETRFQEKAFGESYGHIVKEEWDAFEAAVKKALADLGAR